MTELLAFFAFGVASFINIFLRAFQQLNVMHDRKWLVMPTSISMAACEVFIIVQVVSLGAGWIILFGGVGAGCGTLTALWINRKFMRVDETRKQVDKKNS